MAPPLLGGQGQRDPNQPAPIPPAPPLPPPDDGDDDDESSSASTDSSAIENFPPPHLFRCPLFWCLSVNCAWYGTLGNYFEHFNGEYADHSDYEIDRIDLTEPTLRIWSEYRQTCDNGTSVNEEGKYRLMMRALGRLIFYFNAKSVENNTGMHVAYIGPPQRAGRYSFTVTIENRGTAGAEPITKELDTFPTDGWSDNYLLTNQAYGEIIQNQILKDCCEPDTGDLYFWLELHMPDNEAEELELMN